MKKFKKMFLIVLMFLTMLVFSPSVKAESAPNNVTMKAKSSMYYFSGNTDYISGYNFYQKELSDGTLAYCVSNISSKVPGGKKMTLKEALVDTDKGLDYIIKNGYPNKSFTGDNKKDYYITQAAIWKYFDETRGSTNWKGTTFDSSSTGMKSYVYKLVQEAKLANNNTSSQKPTLSLVYVNKQMSLSSDSKYFVSDLIKVSATNTNGTYTVNLTNAPTGTLIKDQNGVQKTSFDTSEGFRVYVPASSKSGSVTLTITSVGVTYSTYLYTSGNSRYQDIAPVKIYDKITDLLSQKMILTFEQEEIVTKVKISKQDITTKKELPGATLVVKDSKGNIVEKWVSTSEPHYIEGLEPGNYTLTETIAPDGYKLSTETVSFTVREDGTTTNVVMYNESYVTKVKISKQDITTKEEVPGATLVVKDSKGNVVEKWVSTSDPHYIEGLEPGNYTLTETIAPDGYILSDETVSFTVLKNGEITSVVMYNAKESKVTKVKISKQDITTKEEVPGATLIIKDSKGNVVEKWVSTSDPHYIEGLEPGNYTLTETIAPDGYILSDETVSFTVLENGDITSVVMYNEKYVEVPITDLNVNMITIVVASILMMLGTGLVVYYAKHSK